jgi:Ca-dependent carbohydrate-binding module xylan-binding/Right handed beta helix region
MAILTVGAAEEYTTIAAAVAASTSGDEIDVDAGTYTNDFFYIGHSLTLQAVGGEAHILATVQPGNGKAAIVEGVPGAVVKINGFEVSGVAVGDGNGAAIRYEGGSLSLSNDYFHNNQEGILAASDPNGTITIDHSEIAYNGGNFSSGGLAHNIYVNGIAQLTVSNSYIHDANVGHEIKSRAANTIITNDRIFDNNADTSYSIDLPNAGNADITGNIIEQGPHSENNIIMAYGEEGASNPGTNVNVANNTIVSDESGTFLLNRTTTAVNFANNQVWGLTAAQLGGPMNASGTVFLTTRPELDTSGLTQPSSGPGSPSIPGPTAIGSGSDTVALAMSEDAWNGNAQFTVSVDSQQIGGVQTVVALHALGQTQEFDVQGNFGGGQHTVTVNFVNDAYGGTPATDRNLYVTGASYDGVASSGSLSLFSNGPQSLVVGSVPATVPVGSGPDTLDLKVSEDAWGGDAQFTVSVDGQQIGGTLTALASHASGSAQDFLIEGLFGPGPHTATINFINDAYGGTPSTDRNLYVNGATIDGQAIAGSTLTLWANGPQSFAFQGVSG